jgi:hypothetical protein
MAQEHVVSEIVGHVSVLGDINQLIIMTRLAWWPFQRGIWPAAAWYFLIFLFFVFALAECKNEKH